MTKHVSPENGRSTPSPVEPVDGMIVNVAAKTVSVDFAVYQAYLDDTDLPEAEKAAMIEILWSVIVSFVEIGFGLHPVQQAGITQDISCTGSPDPLHSDPQSNQTSNPETDRVSPNGDAGESEES